MDPFKGQGGIRMLLTAEQDAQHIVSDARKSKLTRLKQATQEAEEDVALYRSHMEADFQKKVSESRSGSDAKLLEEETEIKIQNLKKSASRVSSDVVGMLIKYITTVN